MTNPTISWIRPRVSTAGLNLPDGAYFDEEAADRAVRFFSLLKLVEGRSGGKPFDLLPWQAHEVVRPLFGYKRADGSRLYRTVFLELPRKNGKSNLASALALLALTADGEASPQVILAATTRQQARICYDLALRMVQSSPALSKRCRAVRSYIEHPKSGGVLRTVSAEAPAAHGLSASFCIVDEVHAFGANRELWDVLSTSTGARAQPVMMGITTAGNFDPQSNAYQLHQYAEQVAAGEISDPYFLGVIYGATAEDDYTDPEVWRKVNPSLGHAVTEDYLRETVARCAGSPARANVFRQLHLNIWSNQESKWIDPEVWDANGEPLRPIVPGEVRAFAGLDLSSTTDVSAFVVVRAHEDGTFDVHPHFWLPAADILERERRDRLPYREWAAAGFLTFTDGNIVDYAAIRNRVVALADEFGGFTLGYDPWNATGLITELMGAGLTCVPVRQGFATLSAPTKELGRLILGGKLRHAGNPILKAHVGAALVSTDAAGNEKLDKSKSSGRIDGVVSLVMALHVATLSSGQGSGRSIYEERGPVFL